MRDLTILLTFVLFIQILLGIFQINYYDKFIKKIKKKYNGKENYYMNIETLKKFNVLAVIIIITNEKNIIDDAYSYRGIHAFARFKKMNELLGQELDYVLINRMSNYKTHTKYLVEEIIKKRNPNILNGKEKE